MHIKKERKCIACRNVKLKDEMLRIAKIDNDFKLDKNYKLGGRGAYICKDSACIKLVIKKKLLNKAFKTNVDAEIYNLLGEYEQNN